MKFSYLNPLVPDNYKCSNCGLFGCKLWRQYQTFLNHIELMCVDCSLADQDKTFTVNEQGRNNDPMGSSDQIGWLVPAVPDEENETYWGYTSVPEVGCLWWKALPLRI